MLKGVIVAGATLLKIGVKYVSGLDDGIGHVDHGSGRGGGAVGL